IRGHTMGVYSLAFSPDGKTLATGAGDWRNARPGEVKLWEVASGKEQAKLDGLPREVWSLAFTPNGKLLVTATANQLKVWEAATGKEVATLNMTVSVRNLAFSLDGRTLATGHNDGKVTLWNTAPANPAQWKQQTTLLGHTSLVFSVRFSPDGRSLATASKD